MWNVLKKLIQRDTNSFILLRLQTIVMVPSLIPQGPRCKYIVLECWEFWPGSELTPGWIPSMIGVLQEGDYCASLWAYLLHWTLAAFVYYGSWLHKGELVSYPCHPCHVGGKHLKDELEEILPLFCLAFLSQQHRSLTNVDEVLSHAIQAVLHCN